MPDTGPPPVSILATKSDIRDMMIEVFESFLSSVNGLYTDLEKFMEPTDWNKLSESLNTLWNDNLSTDFGLIEITFSETDKKLSYTLTEPEVEITYCEAESACNTGSEGSCRYPTSDRVDCNGNALYCTDPEACNYNEMGDCSYHGSRKDCDGKALYCTIQKHATLMVKMGLVNIQMMDLRVMEY